MKGSIGSYHMKSGGLYEVGGKRLQSRRCRMHIRDRRPVPELAFAIDAELRRQERETRARIRLLQAEEERLARELRDRRDDLPDM